MMNAPTKSEMMAKMSSSVLKNDRLPLTSFDCSLANCSPVIASYGSPSARSARRMRSRTCGLREPGIAPHVDLIPLPDAVHHFLRGRWRERGERRAREAVLLATELEDAGDRELARLDGRGTRSSARSPILNFPSANVCWSRATSSGVRGWRPRSRSSDWFTAVLAGIPAGPERSAPGSG